MGRQSRLARMPWRHVRWEPCMLTVLAWCPGSVASGSPMHIDNQGWLVLRGTYAPVVGRWEGNALQDSQEPGTRVA